MFAPKKPQQGKSIDDITGVPTLISLMFNTITNKTTKSTPGSSSLYYVTIMAQNDSKRV